MSTTPPLSRRNFLRTGVAAGAVAMTAKSYAQVSGANERLNVGIIGCGGMASGHLNSLLAMKDDENVAVTMVCDVYRKRALEFQERVEAEGGEAMATQDHREVLANSEIDYVVIATPEHSHHRLVMDALKHGKHVYCEKPLCHTIREAKEVVAKAKETGLKLQVGVQGMSDDSYSSAHEAILEGKLGPVIEAQIDYVRNHGLDRGPWRRGDLDSEMAKPEDLDWNTWVDPRRKRAWNPRHYFEWRCYRDYSGGISTDLFVHRVTRILKACGLTFPTKVAGMGGIYMWNDGRDLPDNFEMLCEYPATEGVSPGMTVRLLGTMSNKLASMHCIRGHKATLSFTGSGWDIIDQSSGKVVESHTKTGGEDITPHHKNHQAAIRHGAELFCPPELGLYSVVCVRMGNLSWFDGRMVAWDAKRQRVVRA